MSRKIILGFICLMLLSVVPVHASYFDVNISGTDSLGTDIVAFTFDFDVSGDFNLVETTFGDAPVTVSMTNWKIDQDQVSGNIYTVGAADWYPLLSSSDVTTGLNDGLLLRIEYDAGTIDCIREGYIITGYPLVNLNSEFMVTCDGSGATFTPSAVPIPGAVWLLGSGLLGLVTIRRRRG